MSKKKQGVLRPVVTLVAIACLSAFILGYVHELTLEPIKRAKDNQELAAIAEVVGDFDNNPFAEKMTITTKNKKHKIQSSINLNKLDF